IPEREDPRDVLITRERGGLASLPPNAVVGTSSPRRAAFLRALAPGITTREIRGNVETRLRKVRDGGYDATVPAPAGLRRAALATDDGVIRATARGADPLEVAARAAPSLREPARA